MSSKVLLKTINSLIIGYLKASNYEFTLSVFLPECGMSKNDEVIYIYLYINIYIYIYIYIYIFFFFLLNYYYYNYYNYFFFLLYVVCFLLI